MSTDNAIVVENLVKSFKDVAVLRGVNFTVRRGTMLALLGPNGAGKTTIIRILSTLLGLDSGQAQVNGFYVSEAPREVRKHIGLTGQFAAVDEYLSGRENLEMMGRLYHLSRKNSLRRGLELLELFDLTEAADRQVKNYSGGMRRRLDLALSLIATPPILFLDEPTTGLDPRSRLSMWEVIKKLVQSGTTILLTTQYLEEADQLADQIAVIDGGKIIAQGTAEELKNRVGRERLELVIGKKSDFAAAAAIPGAEDLQKDSEARTLSMATDGSVEEVKRILDHMAGQGIEIESLSLHQPTLDDVFLHFTGHKAATHDEEGEKK